MGSLLGSPVSLQDGCPVGFSDGNFEGIEKVGTPDSWAVGNIVESPDGQLLLASSVGRADGSKLGSRLGWLDGSLLG